MCALDPVLPIVEAGCLEDRPCDPCGIPGLEGLEDAGFQFRLVLSCRPRGPIALRDGFEHVQELVPGERIEMVAAAFESVLSHVAAVDATAGVREFTTGLP